MITAPIIKRMNKLNISNDILGSVLFILIGMYENKLELLDELDDNNKARRTVLLYKHLQRINLIELSDEEEASTYALTKEGVDLVEFIKKQFSDKNHVSLTTEVVKTEPFVAETLEDNMETWIEEWINIFPTRQNGRTYRVHPTMVIPRMKEFMDNHGYTKEQIFEATKDYVKEQEDCETGHKYTMDSHYFVYKGAGVSKTSKLAACCYELVNKNIDDKKGYDTKFLDSV